MARLMGIERFGLLAISGGGPYALATAYALPERVTAVSIVSGAPPLGPDVDKRALLPIYRWLLGAYRRRPELFGGFFKGSSACCATTARVELAALATVRAEGRSRCPAGSRDV
jgi:pimeloyl-ACP methyl ester carboxylesterase